MAEQMIDLSLVTPTPSPRTAEKSAVAARELPLFAAEVRATLKSHATQRATVAANQVQVQPGNKLFSTIGEAVASITDASQKKQYGVYLGPGTYNEVVVCKSWVFLQGAGPDQTFVVAPATQDFGSKGTVIGASNSAIQNMTVQSTGNGWGCWAVAVACDDAMNFDIENCSLISLDEVGGANMIALAIDYTGGSSGSQIYVAYTSVLANCVAGQSQPLGLLAFAGSFVQLTESKLIAQGSSSSWGGASNGGSNVIVDDSYVEGTGYCLAIPDNHSSCTANQCQLVGPVYPGVVVNP
jgi:hypothetical protein